eukprot:112695-Hanusia_phi.AAC.1
MARLRVGEGSFWNRSKENLRRMRLERKVIRERRQVVKFQEYEQAELHSKSLNSGNAKQCIIGRA